ncbi:RagB/SusD family nutrient uptake outer membrane protein [Chitinophaga sp. 22321]|uniref:RagB/SusD family nutrient uptake outer membrane protein n=1 Tax=Chitinophaga hostae TaxID=2831022 RepID=A0ABS5IVV4_9BACT|nr:RagB/SusD family nutrient uptake outer membrane protein [Chitinophaga hostae]MBS0026995.1 RagB/SusD family nutrient uptake outer membrane protein [Chitinophaga hostae]
MKKTSIYIIVIIAGLLQSCSKFLDRTPLSNATSEGFWKTATDAEQGINALYATLPDSRDFWRDCSSDNSVMTNAWGEGGMGYICQGSQSATDDYIKEEWRYDYINRALTAIDKLNGMTIDAAKKKQYMGEARFILALRYFRMAQLYGDIPLIKEKPVSIEESNVAKRPKQEVLDYVVKNVDDAISMLPDAYTGANTGRINKAAAMMLRANVYLYMGSYRKFHGGADDPLLWKEAAKSAQDVVNTGAYGLENDYAYLFKHEANNANKEVILAFQYIQNEITNMLPVLALPTGCSITGEGWASFCPTRDLVDSYECTDGKNIQSSALYSKTNPWENRDARLKKTFLLPGVPCLRPDGSYSPYEPHPSYNKPERMNNEGGGLTGFMYLKFAEPDNPKPEEAFMNFPLYRYAETLLILAEALNEYDPGNHMIVTAMNQVRARAGLPGVDGLLGNQATMREKIRDERRHEFVAEHKRYFDILRWKTAEIVLNKPAYGINQNEKAAIGDWTQPAFKAQDRTFNPLKHYTWPIPQEALDKNKNLVQTNSWK